MKFKSEIILPVIALIILLLGVAVTIGWFFDITFLKSLAPGYTAMKFNTAISFILSGILFLLLLKKSSSYLYYGLAFLLFAIAFLSFIQNLFAVDLGVDQVIIKDRDALLQNNPFPGRMAFITSLCFIIISTALLIQPSKKRGGQYLTQWLFHFASLISLVAIIGYILNVPEFYQFNQISSMALHTSCGLFVLTVGLSFINKNIGITGLLTRQNTGNVMARQLFPLLVLMVIFLSFLSITLLRKKSLDAEFAIVLFGLSFILVGLFLIWITAISLNKIDYHRSVAEEKIQVMNKYLEKAVEDRTAQLKQVNEQLSSSNLELERFAYIASHDLQEPLRKVSTFLQLLQNKYDHQLDDTASKYIGTAVDGAKRMKMLINDLLDFSKVNGLIAFTDVNINNIITEVTSFFQAEILESNAIIRVPDLPVIRGNQNQLMQLFQNLIGNALKYKSDRKPIIQINCVQSASEWLFSIQDNGIGIEKKYAEKVFEIFQRLHTKTEYSGTGIGLAICKKIVERHGGKIWLQASVREGAEFCFTINKNI